MAAIPTWQVHWQVPFVSLNGIAYTASIYEWNYSGSIVVLNGAPEPFMTQEVENEDIFTPARYQTGYLRVILTANESSLLEQLMPANNTEKMVRLTHVENNATVIDWQGFMQTQMFSQIWDNNAHLVEFPLNSMLASLEHKRLPSSRANMGTSRALGIITAAFEALGENLMTGCDIIDDCSGAWASVPIDWNAFFAPEIEQEEGYTRQVQYGRSWLEAVQNICETFGLIAREHGGRLVLAQYDNNAGIGLHSLTWADAKAIGAGSSNMPAGSAVDAPADLLTAATWRGIENQADYMPGAHSVEIDFSPSNNGDPNILTIPEQDFDDEVAAVERKTAPLEDNGRVWVQSFDPHTNSVEVFNYQLWRLDTNQYENTTKELCMKMSVLGEGDFDLFYTKCFFGAWPCIYGERTKYPSSVQMRPGLFIEQILYNQYIEHPCYTIKTPGSVSFKAGSYLNINLKQHTLGFMPYLSNPNENPYVVSVYWENYGVNNQLMYVFGLRITIGSKVFQGTLSLIDTMTAIRNNDLTNYGKGSWVNPSPGGQAVYIGFKDTDLINNELSNVEMLSYDGGFLIPITEDMSGILRVEILNQVYRNFDPGPEGELGSENIDSRIITDFAVSMLQTAPPYYSKSSANKYKRNLDNGFKAEIKKTLSLGTINCNAPSPTLLLSADGGYLKKLIYSPSTPGEVNEARPELHLLARMADFYNTTRHAYRGQILQGIDLWKKRWLIDNRIFFGVDATHEWALDRQTAKFIEVEETTN